MANMTVTNVDTGNVLVANGEFRDELLAFGGADTVLAGTILARREVATAVTASAITGTGNGTLTAATVVAGEVPKAGVYTLVNTLVVADGGVFELRAPDGQVVAAGLRLTVGAGAATVFRAGGLQFTVTDGGTNFALNDSFTLTVAADGKLVPFATDGVGGAQNPIAVITYPVTATGAGNLAVRPLISGIVNRNRLIIHADGDGDNVTTAICEQLRDFTVVAHPVKQLAALDNQPT